MRLSSVMLLLFTLAFSSPVFAAETGDIFVALPPGQSGAILVDGKDTGIVAPATVTGVAVGNHMVQVKGNCVQGLKSVDVQPGKITRLDMALETLGGFVEVSAVPTTATLSIDGQPQPNPTAVEVSCGKHVITASAPRYVTQSRDLQVDMGGAYTVRMELPLEGFGNMTVVVDPVTAVVKLDGKDVAVGPTTLDEIPAGKHLVQATAVGFQDWEQSVEVKSGETARVEIKLQPQGAAVAPPPPPEKPPREGGGNAGKTVGGAALVVAGVGALGAGAYMGTQARTFYRDEYEPAFNAGRFDEADALYTDYQSQARKAGLVMGLGGVMLVGGGVVLFIDEDGAGVVYTTRF